MTQKSIRVLANANNKTLRTVNIATSGTNTFKTYTQQTTDNRLWPTVQDSGGAIKGLPTIIIAGYTGPA